MKIILENNNYQYGPLNEVMVNVQKSLPPEIELSIYYTKLRAQLHSEIINFCKEKIDLKADLNLFRMSVGQYMTEAEIRAYLDSLKDKYNGKEENIGIDYHIEVTRIDYGVAVFCIIKRTDINMKKFVFRFRKNLDTGIANLSSAQIPLSSLMKGE